MIFRALTRLLVAFVAVAAATLWPVATARSFGEPGQPATVTVNPITDTNFVGQTHCVTATVRDVLGTPLANVAVFFQVGPSVPSTFPYPSSGEFITQSDPSDPLKNGTTDPPFCYQVKMPGVDTIRATVEGGTAAPTTLQQPSQNPFGEALKVWLPPESTPLCEADITGGGWFIAANGDRVNFGGNALADTNGSPSGQEEYQDQGPAQPMNLHSVEITATVCNELRTTATIFGTATIDGSGEQHVFRIDVTDAGEPGVNDTYEIMLDDLYDSGPPGPETLMGGNITIH
jgi:hypothetical protein